MKKILWLVLMFLSIQLMAAVNINTATKEELTTLKGIGEKTAALIVQYRELHPFEKKEELLNIKGIGQKRLEAIESEITL